MRLSLPLLTKPSDYKPYVGSHIIEFSVTIGNRLVAVAAAVKNAQRCDGTRRGHTRNCFYSILFARLRLL